MTHRLETLSVLAFFVSIAALSIFSIENLDIGFHLATGALIRAFGSIPTHDPFSFIAEGRPWVDSHWLFQVLAHGVHEAAGAPGLVLLRMGLVLATFALVLETSRRRGGLPIALFVTVLAVFSSYQRFILRPGLLTLLFLALFIYGVDGLARHRKRYLIALPFVQMIWVNCHGLWVMGLAYIGLHLIGGAVQDLARQRWPGAAKAESGGLVRRREALLLALCCVASLANANGLAGILYPWTLLHELAGGVAWFPQLHELKPPLSVAITHPLKPEVFYRFVLLLSIVAAIANWKNARLSELVPLLVFLILSVRALRNIPLFAVVAAPITARNLRDITNSAFESGLLRRPGRRRLAVATATAMLVLAGALSAVTVSNELYESLGWHRRFGMAESSFYPSGVVEHLRQSEGRYFNDSNMGGYLIWKLYPEKQVALDGRWEVYGDLLAELTAVMQSPRRFAAFALTHDIRTIALMRRSADSHLMRRWLKRSRDFKLTVRTKNALLYERVVVRGTNSVPASSNPPS